MIASVIILCILFIMACVAVLVMVAHDDEDRDEYEQYMYGTTRKNHTKTNCKLE
jgi:hypothetical protein